MLYSTLRARDYQLTAGYNSTIPMTEVEDHLTYIDLVYVCMCVCVYVCVCVCVCARLTSKDALSQFLVKFLLRPSIYSEFTKVSSRINP